MHAWVSWSRTTLVLLAVGTLVPAAAPAQTYPDPNYPPQGYPQQQYPQQQYPQQQYPQQQYPQQQYPQQQYPQPTPDQQYQPQPYPQQGYPQQGYPAPENQPPPGYYAPAPAYQQQPTYSPPPPAPAYVSPPSPVPRYRQGFLWMPYVGANIPVGDTANGLDTGLRLGAIFGLNINSFLSLNGEMCIDILNIKDAPGTSASGATVDFTFSPLFHFGVPMLEFVIGPKIGSFYSSETYSTSQMDTTYSGEGIAYGFNAGAFLSLGRVALGGLISYTARDYQDCTDCSVYGTDHIFGLTGALMY